ncbi:hypothetical protein BH11ARM2_BH11ARM2_25200 [soil metagenome]
MRDEERVLTDPKRWKAVAHPLRLGILRVLGEGKMTNEELAKALGKPSGALFYHTRRLLEAELLEPAGTRQKGPLTEKLYRRTVTTYRIPVVEDGSAPPLSGLLHNAVEVYENLWRERTDKDFDQLGYNLVFDVSQEAEIEFFRAVKELAERFSVAVNEAEKPNPRMVALTMLIHRIPDT